MSRFQVQRPGLIVGLDATAFANVTQRVDQHTNDSERRNERTAIIDNEATWLAVIQGFDTFGTRWKYYGVEVTRNGYGATPWLQVTPGRVMNNTSPGGETTYALNRQDWLTPLQIGTIVTVHERYDDEGLLVRDIEALAPPVINVFPARVVSSVGATNATYTVNVPDLGINVTGLPHNRWTIPAIQWLPKPVGTPCLVLRFIESGVTTYYIQVLETPVSETCGAGASELSAPPQPAFSAAERLFMAANYR